jgi:hypothetical protein
VTRDGREPGFTILDELDDMLIQLEFEETISRASQVMEIYEMFDKAAAVNSEYGQGYKDGFWSGLRLDAKYQLAKVRSVMEKTSVYLDQYR